MRGHLVAKSTIVLAIVIVAIVIGVLIMWNQGNLHNNNKDIWFPGAYIHMKISGYIAIIPVSGEANYTVLDENETHIYLKQVITINNETDIEEKWEPKNKTSFIKENCTLIDNATEDVENPLLGIVKANVYYYQCVDEDGKSYKTIVYRESEHNIPFRFVIDYGGLGKVVAEIDDTNIPELLGNK